MRKSESGFWHCAWDGSNLRQFWVSDHELEGTMDCVPGGGGGRLTYWDSDYYEGFPSEISR